MRPHPQSLLATAGLRRSLLEFLLLGILLWSAMLWLNISQPPSFLRSFILLLVGPCCLLWLGLRLRFSSHVWWKQGVIEILLAGLGCLLLGGTLLTLNFLPNGGLAPVVHWKHTVGEALGSALELNLLAFIAARIGVRFWVPWDHLRRRRLLLSFAHLQITLIALLGGLLLLATIFILFWKLTNSPTTSNKPDTIFYILEVALFIFGVIIVSLPLSFLFSYLMVRKTTPRLKSLTAATGAVRAGNYTLRIPVNGEDEIAQLQTDFNVMAGDLEHTMQELAQTLAALESERDTVTHLLQERRQLIASVSHELRTPLATLRSYLEITLSGWNEQPAPTLQRNLAVMEKEILHLQSLVDDLFSLARSEVGRLTIQTRPIELAALLERLVEARAPLALRIHKIEIFLNLPSELPAVQGDPQRLEQIFQNLLHNALRHTPPGGIIALVGCLENERVKIEVKDTGEGIAPQDLASIWERFYQAEQGSGRKGGAGLGLSLVKEWIEAMGGIIQVESTLGEGSCFTMYLPLANAHTPPCSNPLTI